MSDKHQLAEFGWAPGSYTINCVDCPEMSLRDRPWGAKRSWRCQEHAIEARRAAKDSDTNVEKPYRLDDVTALQNPLISNIAACIYHAWTCNGKLMIDGEKMIDQLIDNRFGEKDLRAAHKEGWKGRERCVSSFKGPYHRTFWDRSKTRADLGLGPKAKQKV